MKKRTVCAIMVCVMLVSLLSGCADKKEKSVAVTDTIYIGTHGVGDDPRWRNPVTGESYMTFVSADVTELDVTNEGIYPVTIHVTDFAGNRTEVCTQIEIKK